MTAVNVKVRVTVDPAGRVIVWEQERTLPSDRINVRDDSGEPYGCDVSGRWQDAPGAVTYFVDVTLPVPPLPAPTAAIVIEQFGAEKGLPLISRNEGPRP